MPFSNLNDHWVLVTGAASGIGLETAKSFARRGARVLLADVQVDALEAARLELIAAGGFCMCLVLDVADATAVHDLAEDMSSAGTFPSIVVNNAGIGFLGPFLHTPLESWRRVLEVNLLGTVNVCHAFLPGMLASGAPAHIVNVASAAGLQPVPNLSAYSASKHAVMGLHDALAMELAATSVGLTVVCPGVINTPIVRNPKAVAEVVSSAQLEKISRHYERHGAHPSVVAERIVKAVQLGDDLVLVGPTARAVYNVKRMSRSLARWATLQGCRRNGYAWRYE